MREFGWTQQRADSMLALVAMAWGSSYLLMKIGLDGIPPFCIIALRFGIAFIAVSLLFFKKLKKTTKRVMMKGAVLGLFLFGLFAFLMHGLQTTSASNGGFLTSTTVALEPVFSAVFSYIFLHETLSGKGYMGAMLVMAGVVAASVVREKRQLVRVVAHQS